MDFMRSMKGVSSAFEVFGILMMTPPFIGSTISVYSFVLSHEPFTKLLSFAGQDFVVVFGLKT
jgi:hypothetical protein